MQNLNGWKISKTNHKISILWSGGDSLQNHVSLYSAICHRLTNIQWLLSSWRTEWNFILCGELTLSIFAPFSTLLYLPSGPTRSPFSNSQGWFLFAGQVLVSTLPGGSDSKVSVYNSGDTGSIPGLERFPWRKNGNPLQYADLENDGGAWLATVPGVAKSRAWLSDFAFTFWACL